MIERHKMKMLWILLFLVPFSTRICPALPSFSAENESPIFATWDVFEVDKCASIWLIKRFIDPKAKIRIYKKGERIKEGIPFDTPDAKLRRYHNASTYETLLRHYGLKNRRLVYIGKIVHDIEINVWEKKALPETPVVQQEIGEIIKNSSSPDEIISKSIAYFDLFFKDLTPP